MVFFSDISLSVMNGLEVGLVVLDFGVRKFNVLIFLMLNLVVDGWLGIGGVVMSFLLLIND